MLGTPLTGTASARSRPDSSPCRSETWTRWSAIADEIQTGLGRTGRMFARDHEGVRPDVLVLGKALSGGFYPVSAVIASRDVLDVFGPGSHGSTYGGNPLACAVARAAIRVVIEEQLPERAAQSGSWLLERLREIRSNALVDVRGKGLLVGLELRGMARSYCEQLLKLGVLAKETHAHTIRLAPPLIVSQDDLAWLVKQLSLVLGD